MRTAKSRKLAVLMFVLAAANGVVTGFLGAGGDYSQAFSQAIIAGLCFLVGYTIWE